MFVDSSGSLGAEHARDLRAAHARSAGAGRTHRLARAVAPHMAGVRAFAARGQLGRIVNYRAY